MNDAPPEAPATCFPPFPGYVFEMGRTSQEGDQASPVIVVCQRVTPTGKTDGKTLKFTVEPRDGESAEECEIRAMGYTAMQPVILWVVPVSVFHCGLEDEMNGVRARDVVAHWMREDSQRQQHGRRRTGVLLALSTVILGSLAYLAWKLR